MYQRIINKLDANIWQQCMQGNISDDVISRVCEQTNILDEAYGSNRGRYDMGGYILFFNDKSSYDSNIDEILEFYKLDKDLDTEELRKYINSMCEKCVLAPTSDKNKTVCYNVSLSSGTYAIITNKPNAETEINLGSYGLYDISLRPFDSDTFIVAENCSRDVAVEVVKYLKELGLKAYMVDLHYMIRKEERIIE